MTTSKTKKTTAPKSSPQKKPVSREQVRKSVDRIHKLRDSIYKSLNERWTNSYGKDQFRKAIKLLNDAAGELNNMY